MKKIWYISTILTVICIFLFPLELFVKVTPIERNFPDFFDEDKEDRDYQRDVSDYQI